LPPSHLTRQVQHVDAICPARLEGLEGSQPALHIEHLHGHEFQVVEIDGKRFPGAVRDTVLVPPSRRVVVAFDATNPGLWAIHCHLLYHLDAGMFTTLRYV
jgi:FtsP/CotA-like multicopper oxidase with cupredoxin domain